MKSARGFVVNSRPLALALHSVRRALSQVANKIQRSVIVKAKILRDDLRYIIFTEVFQRFNEPKKNRRAFSILEVAIDCFDRKGFANVTFVMVAREAGMTRQALGRYFKNIDDLREVSLKYIRILGQKMALDLIGNKKDPVELFSGYVSVHFTWAKVYRSHARVWLSFLSSCAQKKSDRRLNTLAVIAGHERIVQLIEKGKRSGVFQCADSLMAAKAVQTLLTGWTMSLITEDLADEAKTTQVIIQNCLRTVGYKGLPA